MKRMLTNLLTGIKAHPFRFLVSWYLAYSATWTAISSLAFFFPSLRPQSLNFWVAMGLATMIFGGLLWGLYRAFPRQKTRIRIKSIDTTIEVSCGDLFEAQGFKVIAVNEFFDSQLGQPVSRSSLHGQLIERKFEDHPEQLDQLIDSDLCNASFESIERSIGKQKRYPIGTTPMIAIGNERFLLPALCQTDTNTSKASCDIPMLLKALDGLWLAVRNRAGGHRVSVPLIGSGLSGIGLPPYQLLQLLILSIIIANRKEHIRSNIHIVLTRECLEEIDLDTLESQWS